MLCLKSLNDHGICAISCWGQHHAIVFCTIAGRYITPELMAELLTSKDLVNDLKMFARTPKDVQMWAKDYIKIYG